jgi:hypothetical protein
MGVIYMNESTQNTTQEENSVVSFDDTTMGMPNDDTNIVNEHNNNFGDISQIDYQSEEDPLELAVSGLNTATGMVQNSLSSSLGNSLNNSLGGPTLSNNDTANISAQYPGNPLALSDLNYGSNENDSYQGNMNPMTLAELEPDSDSDGDLNTTRGTDSGSSFGNSFPGTNSSGNSGSFGGSRITFGGKKVKKTALDELIKDMNRITYILKGMKVERKVMNKKSKKNKNKKKNKRTYKKIKRIPRNNRKRSVKKSKK